jgi:hypothetical protein
MKILLLGNSDTSGAFFDGKTWTGYVRDGMAAALGRDVELRELGFSALGPTASAFAEKKVRELDPDIVLLPWAPSLQRGFCLEARGAAVRKARRALVQAHGGLVRRGHPKQGHRAWPCELGCPHDGPPPDRDGPSCDRRGNGRGVPQRRQALARIEDTQVVLLAWRPRAATSGAARPRGASESSLIEEAANDHHLTFIRGDGAYPGIPLEVATTTPRRVPPQLLRPRAPGNLRPRRVALTV